MAGRAAIRYAKAILEVAHDKGVATDVNTDMAFIASTIQGHGELADFIQSPTTDVVIKNSALLEVFADVHSETKNFFRLLLENKRFEILSEIASEYNKQFEEMNGVEVAQVTTAIPMDKEMEGQVLSKILTFSNKKVVIENLVDPSIIGGFILRMGDQQYNASVANRLQVLKRALSN